MSWKLNLVCKVQEWFVLSMMVMGKITKPSFNNITTPAFTLVFFDILLHWFHSFIKGEKHIGCSNFTTLWWELIIIVVLFMVQNTTFDPSLHHVEGLMWMAWVATPGWFFLKVCTLPNQLFTANYFPLYGVCVRKMGTIHIGPFCF